MSTKRPGRELAGRACPDPTQPADLETTMTDQTTPPPADRATLRDRIAAALAEADGWVWIDDEAKGRSSMWRSFQHRADAVLAVLPAPLDLAAVLRAEAERIVEHCPDHGCVEPATDVCHCEIADRLRRMADETPAAECSCAVLRTGPGRHLPECPNQPAAGARQDGA
ncbi:hypothetical protein ACH49_12190, partial [Streptomyces leeuwenhoekii]